MELMVFIHRTENGELEIAVTGPALADSEHEARGGRGAQDPPA
jgi:hypothetical protein